MGLLTLPKTFAESPYAACAGLVKDNAAAPCVRAAKKKDDTMDGFCQYYVPRSLYRTISSHRHHTRANDDDDDDGATTRDRSIVVDDG